MNPITTDDRQSVKRQKKKRRGNRQQQRYRAKLRKEGLNDATINQLLPGGAYLDMEQQERQDEVIITDEVEETLMDQVRSLHSCNN